MSEIESSYAEGIGEMAPVELPTEAEIANALRATKPIPALFQTGRKRRQENIVDWQNLSLNDRASAFRCLAKGEIVRAQARLARVGVYGAKPQVQEHEREAIAEFIECIILTNRDGPKAVEVARTFFCRLPDLSRGPIVDRLLYVRACGPRVRAELLRAAWLGGKSASQLRQNASCSMCLTYFKEADPHHLMSKSERQNLLKMKSKVRLYRGAMMKSSLRATAFALSWTPDCATAEQFARSSGVVMQADVQPDAIIVWWTESGREIEAIVNPRRLRNVKIVEKSVVREALSVSPCATPQRGLHLQNRTIVRPLME